MQSSITNNQFPELRYSNELRSPAVSSPSLTARPRHAKHSCSDLPPAPRRSLRVPPEEVINQISTSMVMGKGDCTHWLSLPSGDLRSWVPRTGASTSKNMHPASRMGDRESLCRDVVSPVGSLFWGREREPLTLAWSHALASAFHFALLLPALGMDLGLFQGMWCWLPET